MPLPAYRTDGDHHRDRNHPRHGRSSRLGLWLSSRHPQQRPLTVVVSSWLILGACVGVYSYAFFGGQPDRSFAAVHTWNEKYKHRTQLRREQIRLARQHGVRAPPVLWDEEEDELYGGGLPEWWQRQMRAGAGGEMAWKREQEALNAGYYDYEGEDEEADAFPYSNNNNNNLRGGNSKNGGKNASTDSGEGGEESTGTTDNRKQRRKRQPPPDPFGDFVLFMCVFILTRSILRICLHNRQFYGGMVRPNTSNTNNNTTNRTTNQNTTAATTTPDNSNTTTTTTNTRRINNSGRSALARLMVPQSMHAHATLLRQARFRAWVTDLNRERAHHGQPPLSLQSLRLVIGNSDFSGNDYEALLRFHEEATIAQSMGASQSEIDRCPQRVLVDPQDHLLSEQPASAGASSTHHSSRTQECSICLEAYQRNDHVRRIPCLHEFHVHCIDPWLQHKAVCPICKHPVVG